MDQGMIFGAAALASLLPGVIWSFRPNGEGRAADGKSSSGRIDVALIAIAFLGTAIWVVAQIQGQWRSDLSLALWLTVASCLGVFCAVAMGVPSARRLMPIIMPYMVILGLLALLWQGIPGRVVSSNLDPSWIRVHIALSVLTYALLTLSAIAGVCVLLRQQSLKTKRQGMLASRLPAIAEAERLQGLLLIGSEVILGLGVLAGIGGRYATDQPLWDVDHKSLLSLGCFGLVGLLLFLQFRVGVRGRQAARMVLGAYLLLTLAYPGVKLVTDLLLA